MRNYIILNENNSNEITGLLIQSLPPISKPLLRTTIEEIDGRDGDIVTNLGYSAYDKEISIGLYGDYDVDEVIKYFHDNQSGQVTFSNEPDKYYNYEIIEQIDFERLIRFKTAIVTLHCQPFKYPTEETPVEIAYQYINNEDEEMSLDNTADAPMKLDLKGNTSQETTTGKNLFNGVLGNYAIDGAGELVSSTNRIATTNYVAVTGNTTYTISYKEDLQLFIRTYASDKSYIGTISSNWENKPYTFTPTSNVAFIRVVFRKSDDSNITPSAISEIQLELGSSATDWEKYSGGIPAPSPTYPQPIHYVSGDNTIEICGKNLFDKDNANIFNSFWNSDKLIANSDAKSIYIKCQPSTTYTISKSAGKTFRVATTIDTPANNVSTLSSTANHTATSITITTEATANYIWVNYFNVSNGDTGNYQDMMATIQLEKGNQASTFEAYTGYTQEIDLRTSKNLFDGKVEQGAYDTTNGAKIDNNNTLRNTNPIAVYPSTEYIFSINGISKALNVIEYDKNMNFIRYYNNGAVPAGTSFTTSSTTKYINFFRGNGDGSDKWQLENGSSISTYEPYTAIELCSNTDKTKKDGLIYVPSTDKLYKHWEIGSVVLSGSASSWQVNSAFTTEYMATKAEIGIDLPQNSMNFISTHFRPMGTAPTLLGAMRMGGTYLCLNYDNGVGGIDNFKTWLSNNNVIVKFLLATPYDEEINNDTLKEQVKTLIQNVKSYDGETHITQNANDKPFILNATALQKGSDTGIVDNEGNIYSKPTLDIEGSGVVGIYLNGNQMFSVDLSNNDECVIDISQLEAYDPETSQLMNRQVTGDYSNFTLPVGENTVKVSGNVTKTTITDYTRWL